MSAVRPPAFNQLPVGARAYVAGLVALAAGGVALSLALEPQLPAVVPFLVIAGLCAVTGLADVLTNRPAVPQAALVMFAWGAVALPAWTLPLLAILTVAPSLRRRSTRWHQTAFNVADYTVAGGAAHAVIQLGAGEGTNGGTMPKAKDLATAYVQSLRANKVWDQATGTGVGVAVIDTGIAGDLTDFRTSRRDGTSRVIASAVVNPDATNAADGYGHGTHIAGVIAGNGANRSSSDPLDGRYAGVAPDANLISVKTSDDHGASTVLDVIEGLQFAVDHRADYNIRVVNLSLTSTSAQSASVDPLDAAAEEAWFHGIVVVTAAGNRGDAPDAVQYAPANDPYVITVGAVDDQGTKDISDDQLAS